VNKSDFSTMTTTLGIALIVRNEEQSLGRCLDSVEEKKVSGPFSE
jgi:hypothetical protein